MLQLSKVPCQTETVSGPQIQQLQSPAASASWPQASNWQREGNAM